MSSNKRNNRKRNYKPYKKQAHLSKAQRADVKKIIEKIGELKYKNINAAQTIAVQIPTITHMTNIPQGTTDNDRIGDELRLEKSYLRLFCGSQSPRNTLRVLFFQWIPDNTNPPTSADILLVGSSGTQDYTSQYNHDKRHLFKIIFDQTYTLVGDGQAATSPNQDSSVQFHQYTLDFTRPKVQYDAASTTVGSNQLYIMYMGDQNGAAAPFMFYTLKLMYRDI